MPWQVYDGIKVGVWQGKTIIIIDHPLPSQTTSGQKTVVDFLVIEKNSVKFLSQLLDRFEFQTLVIGSSNGKELAQELANEAKYHQLHHHNVRIQGALHVTW